ncbi:phosphoglycerate kinase [Candidatus Woesebacteria bacterium]|nr:phosphoglycerate kinase [Candidatus Woesebacteria bacterium]
MKLRTLSPKNIQKKRVLLRVDYNVPLVGTGAKRRVADATRLEHSRETLEFLIKYHAKVLLVTHVGRPKDAYDRNLSCDVIAKQLSKLIKHPVVFCPYLEFEKITAFVSEQADDAVILLENIRFFPGEKKNDPELAKAFAQLADVYVDEAFSTAHRKHMSIVGLPKYLPAYAGFGFAKEVDTLYRLLTKPKRPFVVIVGGAKISDKVEAVAHLARIANVVLVGGGVANNFLAADGYDIANSYLQDCPIDIAKENSNFVHFAGKLISKTKNERIIKDGYIPLPKILYPTDVLAAKNPQSKQSCLVELYGQNGSCKQQSELMYLDIGPKTIRLFQEIILSAGTVFWNGPMGVYEEPAFATGTQEIARAVAKSSAQTIIGGGDTIGAITQFGMQNRYDYISAAGGAALEFLAGEMLPGIEPLIKTPTKTRKATS